MCELCTQDEDHVLIDIRRIHDKPGAKFEKGIEVLAKALGYDSERQQAEISPFKSVRDLEDLTKEIIERRLLKLYEAMSKWFDVSKAKSDPFVLNGRIFINPNTGKPLTNKQWDIIKKDILNAFDYIYAGQDERIVLHAMSLGRVLKGMSLNDAISMGYSDLKSQVQDTMSRIYSPAWRDQVTFAQQHVGELIVDLKQKQYKKIHDTIFIGIKDRQNHRELQENLFDTFGELNRDWRRIAETEIGNSVNNAQLLTELDRKRDNEQVFMRGVSAAGACPWCRDKVNEQIVALVTEPPANGDTIVIAGKPYTAIWPGKDNYGRKRADWRVAAGVQHPHTFSKDTEVFTDAGWKLFPDLKPEYKILALNPDTREVDFVRYTEFVSHYQDKMVHLSGRNYDLKVTPEHRQLYLSRKTGKLIEDSVGSIIKKSDFSLPRAIGVWKRGSYDPVSGLDEVTYARLWAWFLADGCAVRRRGGALQVVIRQKDPTNIRNDLGELISSSGHIRSDVKFLFEDYVGVRAWDKWIPHSVKNLTVAGLNAFIAAYLKSDGHSRAGKPGHPTSYSRVRGDSGIVYTTSKRLAGDLSEIIVKAGFVPSFHVQRPTGKDLQFPNGTYRTKHDVHIITICKSKYRRFSKNMGVGSIKLVDYNDIAYDVQLEKWHHLLVRRNGKVAWSGNCRCTWVKYVPGFEDVEAKFRAAMNAAMAGGS